MYILTISQHLILNYARNLLARCVSLFIYIYQNKARCNFTIIGTPSSRLLSWWPVPKDSPLGLSATSTHHRNTHSHSTTMFRGANDSFQTPQQLYHHKARLPRVRLLQKAYILTLVALTSGSDGHHCSSVNNNPRVLNPGLTCESD